MSETAVCQWRSVELRWWGAAEGEEGVAAARNPLVPAGPARAVVQQWTAVDAPEVLPTVGLVREVRALWDAVTRGWNIENGNRSVTDTCVNIGYMRTHLHHCHIRSVIAKRR